jgi:2-(1,2-epoxy-1,2-dihydrophenyl)acetyl-CoA isomerase
MGFIRIAAAPDMGSSYFLAERVGLVRAKKMAFTGEVVNAEEALRIGLVNEVIDHREISDKVIELAQRIARRSVETLAWTKRVMNKYQSLELQSVLELEAHVQPIMLLSEDHRAAVKKIMDRWLQKDESD